MKNQLKLIAMATALLLSATACGSPAASPSSVSASDSSSSAPSSQSESSQAPAAPVVEPVKPATGFSLSIPMQYDSAAPFSDGLALVGAKTGENQFKYSYIDTTGKVAIDLDTTVYDATPFANGIATVYLQVGESQSRVVNYIDKTGKMMLETPLVDERGMGGGGDEIGRALSFSQLTASPQTKYISGTLFSEDLTAPGAVLYDSSFKAVIPSGQYNYLEWIPDTEYVIAAKDAPGTAENQFGARLYGVIKLDGSTVIELNNFSVGSVRGFGFSTKETMESAASRFVLYDGTVVEPQGFTASELWAAFDNKDKIVFVVAEADGTRKYGTMDKTGKVIDVPSADSPYSTVSPYSTYTPGGTEVAVATPAGLVTLWNDQGSQIVATGKERDAEYKLVPDVKVGLADLAGNILVQPTYEGISPMRGGMFVISNGYAVDEYGNEAPTEYTLVSADEKVKSDAFKQVGTLSENMIAVSDGSKWGYLSVAH